MPVEQLHHEAGKSLERPGYADGGVHPDKHVLGRLDVDLEPARLVDGRVQ